MTEQTNVADLGAAADAERPMSDDARLDALYEASREAAFGAIAESAFSGACRREAAGLNLKLSGLKHEWELAGHAVWMARKVHKVKRADYFGFGEPQTGLVWRAHEEAKSDLAAKQAAEAEAKARYHEVLSWQRKLESAAVEPTWPSWLR